MLHLPTCFHVTPLFPPYCSFDCLQGWLCFMSRSAPLLHVQCLSTLPVYIASLSCTAVCSFWAVICFLTICLNYRIYPYLLSYLPSLVQLLRLFGIFSSCLIHPWNQYCLHLPHLQTFVSSRPPVFRGCTPRGSLGPSHLRLTLFNCTWQDLCTQVTNRYCNKYVMVCLTLS